MTGPVAPDKARPGWASLPLRLAPWLAVAAMAALMRRRRASGPVTAPTPRRTPWAFEVAEPGRGRNAHAPWAIPTLGWKDILWRAYRDIGRDRLPSLAGGVTFYLLLATFPALAAFVSIYGLFMNVDSVATQLARLSDILPDDAVNLIGDQLMRLAAQKHEALGAAFAVSMLVSIWSANAGMKALFDGLNVAYGEVEKRPYLKRSLITYGATLGSVFFLAAAAAMTVAAPISLHALGLRQIHLWLTPLRWLAVYLMAAGGFTVFYRVGPSRAPARWRWVACGGLAAALAWMAGSLVFSWGVNHFGHFGATYGSLGAVIGFMLWMWFSLMVVLIGGVLNAEIEHQTARDSTRGPPRPLGSRGAVMADSVGPAFTISSRQATDLARSFAQRRIDGLKSLLKSALRDRRLS
jgi:membrane protein